jgi:hypothetical protein
MLLSSYLSGPYLTQLTLPRMLRSQRNAAVGKDKVTERASLENCSVVEDHASVKCDEPSLRSASAHAVLCAPTSLAEKEVTPIDGIPKSDIPFLEKNLAQEHTCRHLVKHLVSAKLRSKTARPSKCSPANPRVGLHHGCRNTEHLGVEAHTSLSLSPSKRCGNSKADKKYGHKKNRTALGDG